MSGFDSFGDDPQLAAAHLRSAGVDYEAIRAKWKGAAHVGMPSAVPTDSYVVPEARREKNAQATKKLSKFIVCERCAGSGLFKELYNHRYIEKNCVDCDGNGLLLKLQNGKTVPYDSHNAELAELARQQDEPASAESAVEAMNASENAAPTTPRVRPLLLPSRQQRLPRRVLPRARRRHRMRGSWIRRTTRRRPRESPGGGDSRPGDRPPLRNAGRTDEPGPAPPAASSTLLRLLRGLCPHLLPARRHLRHFPFCAFCLSWMTTSTFSISPLINDRDARVATFCLASSRSCCMSTGPISLYTGAPSLSRSSSCLTSSFSFACCRNCPRDAFNSWTSP